MTTTTLTTREARQRLFTIDAPEADALRRKLFEVVEQDEQLDIDAHGEFNGVILNWGNGNQEPLYNITMKDYDGTIEEQMRYLRGRVAVY